MSRSSTSRDSHNLSFDDLVNAYFDEAMYRSKAKALAEYHGLRLRVLALLFECDFTDEPSEESAVGRIHRRDLHEVRTIARRCLQRHESIHSPFGGSTEGVPGPLEQRLRDGHAAEIYEVMSRYCLAMRATFSDCLRMLYPGIEERTVRKSALTERGVPPEAPDPLDFW